MNGSLDERDGLVSSIFALWKGMEINMDMLKISGLTKSFGEKEVLKGLNLTVPEHGIFGFIGQNGAGKTTTMKMILGLLKADSGEIKVAGERVVFGQTKTNRHIGYLPDVPEFYPYMTPAEYLAFCGEITGMEKSDIQKRSTELLDLVGLAGEKHRIKGFSRGMKQRLGIAQALLNRPKLLICDEPTSALDPVGRKEILDILWNAKEQTTILFSTHILSDVERICTEIACLNDGKVAFQGNLSDIKEMHSSHGFKLELEREEDVRRISEIFEGGRQESHTNLIFQGKEKEIYSVMSYISDNKIPFVKMERMEPTLESLFLEVVGK